MVAAKMRASEDARDLGAPKAAPEIDWKASFGKGDLVDWQLFMLELRVVGYFTSKKQCREALQNVYVNIVDLLEAIKAGNRPHRFETPQQLREYTRKTKKFYPKSLIPKGHPVRSLFVQLNTKGRRRN
ncbi:hypothetical protein F5Y13DRAFT_186808 [Hypoxylon sp. FL1857]|nr:hypothetical protein F5Y13DRAFT_186808 [Hypoxylon sp. FL1857]